MSARLHSKVRDFARRLFKRDVVPYIGTGLDRDALLDAVGAARQAETERAGEASREEARLVGEVEDARRRVILAQEALGQHRTSSALASLEVSRYEAKAEYELREGTIPLARELFSVLLDEEQDLAHPALFEEYSATRHNPLLDTKTRFESTNAGALRARILAVRAARQRVAQLMLEPHDEEMVRALAAELAETLPTIQLDHGPGRTLPEAPEPSERTSHFWRVEAARTKLNNRLYDLRH